MIEEDQKIKLQAKSLKEKIEKTVALDGIEESMEIKLVKYLNKELLKTSKLAGRK